MNNEKIIQFKNVTKVYKLYKNDKQRFLGLFSEKVKHTKFKALDDVSFTVNKGDSVGVLGRNGAGKSTLLKLITGVTFPTTGHLEVNGKVAALLELTAGFDSEMTGRENIYLKGYVIGLSEKDIKEIESAVIDFAELGEFIDQPVRTYSSGMKARLGFALNANIKPEILVIDEALSVGDANFAKKCRAKVKEIIAYEGTTVLFVSHDANKIKEFCDKAIVMERGKIVKTGSVEEVVAYYK